MLPDADSGVSVAALAVGKDPAMRLHPVGDPAHQAGLAFHLLCVVHPGTSLGSVRHRPGDCMAVVLAIPISG